MGKRSDVLVGAAGLESLVIGRPGEGVAAVAPAVEGLPSMGERPARSGMSQREQIILGRPGHPGRSVGAAASGGGVQEDAVDQADSLLEVGLAEDGQRPGR